MIKLVILDSGGVLYEADERIIKETIMRFLQSHGIGDLEKGYKVWRLAGRPAFFGKISAKDARDRWLEGVGLSRRLANEWIEIDKEEIWKRLSRTQGVNRLLRRLKKKYIVVTLSDTPDSKQEKIEKMEILGIDYKVFDEIFTSHDLHACKPDKKAFFAVLRRFNTKPKEALFVSDSCDELKGARKIGLLTIGFKSGCGDYKIKRLYEINNILQALCN